MLSYAPAPFFHYSWTRPWDLYPLWAENHAENYSLGFRGADCHPGLFTLAYSKSTPPLLTTILDSGGQHSRCRKRTSSHSPSPAGEVLLTNQFAWAGVPVSTGFMYTPPYNCIQQLCGVSLQYLELLQSSPLCRWPHNIPTHPLPVTLWCGGRSNSINPSSSLLLISVRALVKHTELAAEGYSWK